MEKRSRKKNIAHKNDEENKKNRSLSSFDTKLPTFVSVNKENKSKNKIKLKYLVLSCLFILLVLTIIFSIRFINFNTYELLWKTSVTKGSNEVNNKSVEYQSFIDGLARISNDGVTFIDGNGKIAWTVSYNMKEPIYDCKGNNLLIADRNSDEFYIFGETGLIGKNNSSFPIQKICMSDSGVVYIAQADENSSYVSLFRKNGDVIDISLKTNLTGDGMAQDISVSKDGTELCMSYIGLMNNKIYSKATYYNFDEVGKNVGPKRIVGEFIDEFENKLLGKVHFFDNDNSFLFYDSGVYFVSTEVLTNPNITKKIQFNENIRSISMNEKYLAIVFEDNKLSVFNKDGSILADKELNYDYDNFYINDDYIVFLLDNRVMIYDVRGRMIFDKELDYGLQYVSKKRSLFFTELLVGLVDGVECIRFY